MWGFIVDQYLLVGAGVFYNHRFLLISRFVPGGQEDQQRPRPKQADIDLADLFPNLQ
jgi:hypothetical protein